MARTSKEVLQLHKEVGELAKSHGWDMFYIFTKVELTQIPNRRMLMQRVDVINNCITLYERYVREFDILKFNPKNRYSGWKIEDIHENRLDFLFETLEAIKNWISGTNENIKDYANAIVYGNYDNNDLNFISFKSNKKMNFNSWVDNTGYFYDSAVGEKELIFIKKGYTGTYSIECKQCGRKYFTAYKNLKFEEIDGKTYCEVCLSSSELNYGICDHTGKKTFRKHLKFSSKKDKDQVLALVNIKDDTKKMTFDIDKKLFSGIGNIRICDRCHSHYVRPDNYNGYYCSDCRLGTVYSYGTKGYKTLDAEGENDVKTHYGFELETHLDGSEYKAAYEINKKISDLIILKHDASLDSGFEIVSNTLSYKRFLKEKSRIASALKTAMEQGCYSKETSKTGLHIHISRSGFDNADHLARFCNCWYLDKKFTRYIAQRDFGSYREWDDNIARDKSYFKEFLRGNLYENRDRSRSRYGIVNLNNTDTVELRMFKGILSIDYLSFAIEISELVKNYSKGATDQSLSSENMIKYVVKNATRRLRGWINSYVLSEKYAIKEGC